MILSAGPRGFRVAPINNDSYNTAHNLIGSAAIHTDETGDGLYMSCTTSVHNLRKLQALFPGLELSPDPVTQQTVDILEMNWKVWRAANLEGMAAKAGAVYLPVDNYQWKQVPYAHQVGIVNFLHAMNGFCAVFGDPGIGKTFAILAWVEQLLLQGRISPGEILVFTKPSIIDSGWLDDVKRFTGLRALSLSALDSNDERKEALFERTDVDLYIIGYELSRYKGRTEKSSPMTNMLKRKRFKLVIFDESTMVKSRTSITFRACRDISAGATAGRVCLTGTPAPNGAVDLWSQFYLIDRGMTLEPSLTDFKHQHYFPIKLNGYNDKRGNTITIYKPRKDTLEIVHKRISPRTIRIKAEDCLDLPPTVEMVRHIDMEPQQWRIYQDMRDELYTEFEAQRSSVRQEIVKALKLQQITSGFLIPDRTEQNPTREPTALPGANPKMVELDNLLEEIVENNKALVFCNYHWEFKTLVPRYRELGYNPEAIYGETPMGRRGDIIRDFQEKPKCRVLFCHPESVGYGVTLTAANYAIYYTLPYFDGEQFYQSQKRIARIGQSKTMFYYYLLARKSIDRVIWKALKEKKTAEDLMVDGPRGLLFPE